MKWEANNMTTLQLESQFQIMGEEILVLGPRVQIAQILRNGSSTPGLAQIFVFFSLSLWQLKLFARTLTTFCE